MSYLETKELSVGYHGNILIHDINIRIEKGKILTLVGPNGAGKSTILKSITRHLRAISGSVYVQDRDMHRWSAKEMATHLAVVLTDRIHPELMTCQELVAMGRYPHTNAIGKLTEEDRQKVEEALALVHGEELSGQDFGTLSDGQKQRILLARAICQDTEIIVLDEPTAYLDIRYKVEFLEILRKLAREKGTTIILSLHEIDLACKISDKLLCVKGDRLSLFGDPEELLGGTNANRLYDMEKGSYNPIFGSVELSKPEGAPRVFVLGGGGYGIPIYRQLQKWQVPFAAGILFENEIDTQVARDLASAALVAPAFSPIPEAMVEEAFHTMKQIGAVLDTHCPIGPFNACNGRLLELAKDAQIPIFHHPKELWQHRTIMSAPFAQSFAPSAQL